MPPPVNGDWNSANGDGGDLTRTAMVADRAPKAVSFLAVVHGQNGSFGQQRWPEIKAGDVKNRTQPVGQPNSGEIDGDENGLSRGLSSFDHWRSGCFPVTMTGGYDRRHSSFRSIPSLTETVAVNESRIRVGLVGRVGLNGSISLSLLLSRVPLSPSSFGN